MKIDWKSKSTKLTISLVLIVCLPILWHKGSGIIAGLKQQWLMSQPQVVQVMNPIQKEIYPEFQNTGRVEAKYSVNVIARVDGWLEKKYFEEGQTVSKGQTLFSIEPDEYRLAVRNAQARVDENRAVYQNSNTEYGRAKKLLAEDFVSHEYYDNALAEKNRSRAALDGAEAQLNTARLNLSYTSIKSPMTGRVGKLLVSEGNYVTASTGPLTTIYSISPMKVTFSLKSSDFTSFLQYVKEHKELSAKDFLENKVRIKLRLSNKTDYESVGKIEFVDNKIDETTGGRTFRAIFDNSNEFLVPGDYVNVILQLMLSQKVTLIPQSATKTDVGTGYYVWVVDKNNKTVKRNIKVSNNYENNWVVEAGLAKDDKVIVKGIQNIYHSGQSVKPEPYVPETDKAAETKDAEKSDTSKEAKAE